MNLSFKKYSVLFLGIGFVVGCAQGNCRSQSQIKPTPAPESKVAQTESLSKIKVYKYDGSLQCGMGQGVAPATMAKDLGSIKVYSSENKADGLMHIQQCGTPTGKANVYEIDSSSLPLAKKAGFREWTFE